MKLRPQIKVRGLEEVQIVTTKKRKEKESILSRNRLFREISREVTGETQTASSYKPYLSVSTSMRSRTTDDTQFRSHSGNEKLGSTFK